MRIILETLGCKMNFADSEKIHKALSLIGFSIVTQNDCEEKSIKANFAILNTCTVTDNADKKSKIKLKNLLKCTDQVLITGCGVKAPEFNSFEKLKNEIIILKTPEEVIDYFKEISKGLKKNFTESYLFAGERTRAFVPIQNGCDTYCSYCIVPFVRGRSQNRPDEDIVNEINELDNRGFKEIVLTGINLAAWGASSTNKPKESRLPELLDLILKNTGIPRIRLSSVGPEFLESEFFEVFVNPRICDHLHLSIQSGSENILKKMNRGHGVEEIRFAARNARQARSNVALTSDIIVGFPGESDDDFAESIKLAREIKLAKIHVFPFSPRKGTLAAKMPMINVEIIKNRAQELRKIGLALREDFLNSQKGKTLEVLFEHNESGLSTNYIRASKIGAVENSIERIIFN